MSIGRNERAWAYWGEKVTASELRAQVGRWLIGINLISMVTSMALMEISSWLLWVLVVANLCLGKQSLKQIPNSIIKYIGLLVAFWIVAMIGLLLSQKTSDLDMIGNTRWAFLAMAYPLAFFWWLKGTDKKFYFRWMGLVSITALYTLWQFITGIELIRKEKILYPFGPFWRATGFFNMPLTWSALIGMVALVGLAHLFFTRHSWREKVGIKSEIFSVRESVFVSVAVILSMAALVATMTRGAWLAFGLGAIIIWTQVLSRKGVAGLIGFSLILVLGMSKVPGVGDRIVGLLNFADDTYKVRIDLWRANWDLFMHHPWFGVGYGQNYLYLPEAYVRLGIQNGFISHAHSNYMQMLSGTGIFGFLFFLTLVIGVLKMSFMIFRTASNDWFKILGLGLAGAQLQVHLGGLTENNFTDGEVNHLLILVWGLVVAIHAIDLQGRKLRDPQPT